jgi:hypothetical protein
MTIIAIRCPACRTTDDVPAPALFVDVDAPADDLGDEGRAATVSWVCGACDELVSVPVEWAPLLAVVSAGAALIETPETAGDLRPTHPESHAGGARLTTDDLLDFHQGLDTADWLDELCACAEPQLEGPTRHERRA